MALENLIDDTHFVLSHPNVVPVSVFQSRDDVPLLSIAYVRNWGQHGLKASLKGKNSFNHQGNREMDILELNPTLIFVAAVPPLWRPLNWMTLLSIWKSNSRFSNRLSRMENFRCSLLLTTHHRRESEVHCFKFCRRCRVSDYAGVSMDFVSFADCKSTNLWKNDDNKIISPFSNNKTWQRFSIH